MWDAEKGSRFQQLRQQQGEHGLSEPEQAELTRLLQEIEAAESSFLAPATERIRKQREALEQQNRSLEALVGRKEALALRLRDFLGDAQAERQAIKHEMAAVLAADRGSETDE